MCLYNPQSFEVYNKFANQNCTGGRGHAAPAAFTAVAYREVKTIRLVGLAVGLEPATRRLQGACASVALRKQMGLAAGLEPATFRLRGGCTAVVLCKHEKGLTKKPVQKGMKKSWQKASLLTVCLLCKSAIKCGLQFAYMVGNGMHKEAIPRFLILRIFHF